MNGMTGQWNVKTPEAQKQYARPPLRNSKSRTRALRRRNRQHKQRTAAFPRSSMKSSDRESNMQPGEDHAAWKARLMKRLTVVVDTGQTHQIRLAAIRAVQQMYGPDSSLRKEGADDLLGRVLNPWDRKETEVDRRTCWIPVKRPPQGVRDVWA
jgi:hypothetical protein